MRATFRLASHLAPVLLSALALATQDAAAQISGSPSNSVRAPQQAAPQLGAAPALPGLAARRAPAPIAGDPATTLSPNDALFDAINRGDLPAARDAVARGANLGARNALGLTPLDAAVDQGRHEIAFYLLSTRDLTRAPPPPPGASALSGPPPAASAPARREPSAAARTAAAAIAGAAGQPATPATARLWANDGGTPRPGIGFLGFDAGRPEGAAPPAGSARRAGRS
ncbi:ankyrin repeat domain-containing protein [Falsiroseomonas sp.]|uniref:ankyrin repeat domain-containing protein n=1 Tax=Falsiroseomonas sp. TaxID=2870721 RepID=UPI0035698E74